MKKIYSSPKVEVVTLDMNDIIATSSASLQRGTGQGTDIAEGNVRDGNPIWD